MDLSVGRMRTPAVAEGDVEIVERKGRGHPDSLCDAIAEELSRALCRFYLEHFGTILHHNVDKALLCGGAANAAFGGGRVLAPIRIYIAGRATLAYGGIDVPVGELALDGSRAWLSRNMCALDPMRHVEVVPLVRAGSADLVELFVRQQREGVPLANDSSIGVGFAPLTELERTVLAVESALNAGGQESHSRDWGEDIKVLGVRRGERLALTIACAFIDARLADLRAYVEAKEHVRQRVLDVARELTGREIRVDVNTADDVPRGGVYLTVTGTSAEAGDDGQAGRGNRVNGLITPYRPMTLESAAGKNPVSHVGKLYQYAAQRIAEAVVAELDEVLGAECYLVSQIGRPIDDPEFADVRLDLAPACRAEELAGRVDAIVQREMTRTRSAWREIVAGHGAGDEVEASRPPAGGSAAPATP